MSLRFLFILLIAVLAHTTDAQTTYTWVGANVGDYQVSSNWSPVRSTPASNDILAFNAAAPIVVANVPNQTIGAIKILSGTSSVTFNTNVVTNVLTLSAALPLDFVSAGTILAGDLLTISLANPASFAMNAGTFGIAPSSGGKVNISSNITLGGGTLDFDVVGTGGASILSGGSITYSSGNFLCSTNASITWMAGSNYYHATSGAAYSSIPAGIWNTGSTCNITGFNGGTIAPGGFTGVFFSNVVWNCPSQTGNVDLNFGGVPVNILNAFTVTSTGSAAIRFSGTGAVALNVGTYSQTGGTVVLQPSTGNTTLTVNGSFSHTGGTIDFTGSGGSAAASTVAVKGNLTKGAASAWTSSSTNTASVMNLQFFGNSSQVVSIAGTWGVTAGRCNIINNNTDVVGVSVTGTLRVYNINSSAAATCTNGGNFTGSGAIAYSGSGAGTNNYTLIYNGSAPQTASSVEFPGSSGPYNLTISSAVGVSFPSSFNRTIAGTLSMFSGGLSLGTNTLSLINASLGLQLVYAGGFITSGTLSRRFPTGGLPTNSSGNESRFPFGTGSNDRSVNIFFSSSSLTGGTGGDIAVSHSAIVNATPLSTYNDNGSLIDKRTNSFWTINTGTFALGSGGTTISVTAQANNIGSVDNISTLRLISNSFTGFGTLIPTTGTVETPLVGKSGLTISDINSKTFYVGSDAVNALQIVTFTWTGAVNTDWTNAGNWTGGVGYPSAPTEVAIINTVGGNMPVIGTGVAVNVYQLSVGAAASLTMNGTASISVYDLVSISGTVSFASTSSFNYASAVNAQTILDLPYGNLGVSGSAVKTLPATTTVTGDFTIAGAVPAFGTGTFVYAAGSAPIQRVAATNYYNLSFTGNRGGRTIRLGNGVSPNTIDVANVFSVTATNYLANDGGYNTFNFSSASAITIPGFKYGALTNTAPAGTKRILDPLGSSDPEHVISCRAFGIVTPYVAGDYTTAGSKVKLDRSTASSTTLSDFNYYDFELTGNLNGTNLAISGQLGIAGTFTVSATNYVLNSTTGRVYYNGTGSQTIAPFEYNNLWIAGTAGAAGTRIITLPNAGTISVRNQLAITGPTTFSAGNGFSVTGSTVNFFIGSNNIPVLPPAVAGGNNYHNVTVTGGTRILGGDLKLGGNLSVIGADGNTATLNIGNALANRILTIAGNLSVTGTSASSALTSTLDCNAGAANVRINLAGNLSVSGTGQLTTTNGSTLCGTILFNGTIQQYSNTAIFKNGFINFTIGDGTNSTTLTLNNSLELIRSGVAPFSSTVTIASNSVLNAGTQNISIGTDDNNVGNNAVFNLNSNATLITANTGAAPNTAIEGAATSGTTGTILAGSKITKTYSTGAHYVLNGATVNPFPAAISTMANLTIGANVSLNKAIVATGTLDLAANTLTQASNNLQFSGLTSTTGNIYADANSTLSISGSIGTVGPLRFATGGNTTGQFTIDRPVTVALNSDLTISKTVLSGNFITGTTSSILDINGNTLTINGAISGPGTLSGSNTSNLTLGGAAGTVNFTVGKRVLKNLSLVSNATAALGTALDITDGTTPGTEGSVSVTGTAILTTAGNLTLKSSANGTARVGQGSTAGGYISGDVTVERYLAAKRAWRFLAAPAYGQTIKQAWQENQPAGVNPGTGYGTLITSNIAAWAANGFDFLSNTSSILTYRSTDNTWQPYPNTTSPITSAGANTAYMLFSRGDRSVTPAMGTGATPTPVLLRIKGTLFQGNQPPVLVSTAGEFAAVGNNYAAPIDFTALSKTNIDNSFSVWDPKLPGAQGLGAWVTFSASTPIPWQPIPAGGSYVAGVPNTKIESGQAFMVHTTSGSGSVIINESSKSSGSALVSRPMGNGLKAYVATSLLNRNTGVANISDGNMVVFSDEYADAIDADDAIKATNFGDNFGIQRNGKILTVDARSPLTENDTVFFAMKWLKGQPYRLELTTGNFDNTITGFLEDKYTGASVPVDMMGTTTYDFTVINDPGAYASDRFRIVFKNVRPLSVTFTSISATKKDNGNAIDWKVANEINVTRYEVERSTDGANFLKVGSVAPGLLQYGWLDAYPLTGDNFYRVRCIDKNGKIQYSSVVKVSAVKGKAGYSVYPNPSTDGSFGLQMSNMPAGIYTVKITNGNGQLVWRELVQHSGGTATNSIHPGSQLPGGTYQLEVTDITGNATVIKVMIF